MEFKSLEFTDSGNIWHYNATNIEGWDVYIEQEISVDAKFMLAVFDRITKSLQHINKNVPKDRVAQINKFPIWVSNEPNYPDFRPEEKAQIPFHLSEEWLRENRLNPFMAPGVHVINPYYIISYTKHFEWQPLVLLHELSHGLHMKVLTDLEKKLIDRAYENADAKGLYRDQAV